MDYHHTGTHKSAQYVAICDNRNNYAKEAKRQAEEDQRNSEGVEWELGEISIAEKATAQQLGEDNDEEMRVAQ